MHLVLLVVHRREKAFSIRTFLGRVAFLKVHNIMDFNSLNNPKESNTVCKIGYCPIRKMYLSSIQIGREVNHIPSCHHMAINGTLKDRMRKY